MMSFLISSLLNVGTSVRTELPSAGFFLGIFLDLASCLGAADEEAASEGTSVNTEPPSSACLRFQRSPPGSFS